MSSILAISTTASVVLCLVCFLGCGRSFIPSPARAKP